MARPSAFRPGLNPTTAIHALVGNTPLLQISYTIGGVPGRVFAKYEAMNMTGSTKDRMAAYILRHAYERRELTAAATIVEASSGNTGISFAAIGRALGHPVRIFMPDWMSEERKKLIAGFGADIVLVSKEEGGFVGSVELAERFARDHDHVFLPRQFDNECNIAAHELGTGPEIDRQLTMFGRAPDAFVAGVGTGGTVMGVGRFLRRVHPGTRVHPLEPANSPTLRTGHKVGKHRIQGISDEFIPSIVHLDELDDVVDVWDGDAILMAQKLCRDIGLAVGISSGANFLGAVRIAEQLGPEATVVTVFPDSNKKYLSTDLCQTEPVHDEYSTPRIELEAFKAVR
ncbi:MAG: cysteine synthase family protein [Planctomycetes bacterium]|nr:cysteine synthase family protein [Planctomycetota bacterium]